jgi:hypothetical protein
VPKLHSACITFYQSTTVKPLLNSLLEPVNLNTEMREIINGYNIPVRLLTRVIEIESEIKRNLKSLNIK